MIKKIGVLLLAGLMGLKSCEGIGNIINHGDIWSKLNDHEARIATLEIECSRMNKSISSLQVLLEAVENNLYITDITSIEDNGVEVGYRFVLSNGEELTIYVAVSDGDGSDGYTPVIGVGRGEDGRYYWTLDGEWLLDDQGNKIPTTGKDGVSGGEGGSGEQGVPGEPGKDGITPMLKIEEGFWYVSYDEGETWIKLGQATGDPGPQGKPGVGGDSMFTDVDYSSSEDYVILYLNNGEVIQIPTWSAFQDLKLQCEKANENVESLQTIVDALEKNDYVTSVTPVYEGTVEIGYVIRFSQSGDVTIYHGKDGDKGEDGYSPVIGVAKDAGGRYYWTLDGEWLLDDHGNKIPTTGKDGGSGGEGGSGEQDVPGEPGKDGITPMLKIEEGFWYVSYDEGETWIKLGQATGDSGPEGKPGTGDGSFFKSVMDGDETLVLVLSDGTEINVPKVQKAAAEVSLSKVSGNAAVFNGTINRTTPDLKVAVYYATYEKLSVYKYTGSSSLMEFSGKSFTLRVNGLVENTCYYYFTEVTANGTKTYSEIGSFYTGDDDAYVDWGEGDNLEGNI